MLLSSSWDPWKQGDPRIKVRGIRAKKKKKQANFFFRASVIGMGCCVSGCGMGGSESTDESLLEGQQCLRKRKTEMRFSRQHMILSSS